jgi:hypothetical protein
MAERALWLVAHRASNEHRIFAVSSIIIPTVKHPSGIVVFRWEAPKKSNESGLIIHLSQNELSMHQLIYVIRARDIPLVQAETTSYYCLRVFNREFI